MKQITNKTNTMKQIEQKLGGEIEEILRALYVDEHMNIYELCDMLNISYLTALKWLRLAGVRSRKLRVE